MVTKKGLPFNHANLDLLRGFQSCVFGLESHRNSCGHKFSSSPTAASFQMLFPIFSRSLSRNGPGRAVMQKSFRHYQPSIQSISSIIINIARSRETPKELWAGVSDYVGTPKNIRSRGAIGHGVGSIGLNEELDRLLRNTKARSNYHREKGNFARVKEEELVAEKLKDLCHYLKK